MATVTKKELIDRIAEQTGQRRSVVKDVIQKFLDEMIDELGRGSRLEFRDFGVFECRSRKARMAQNPKTLDKVPVPPRRTVKFKVGRLMKKRLSECEARIDPATGLPVETQSGSGRARRGARAIGG